MPESLHGLSKHPAIFAVCLAGMISVGGVAAEPESMPFRGVPYPIPGRIEAEEFDRGGDGFAFHGAGLGFLGYPGMEITRGRPDAEISVGRTIYGQGPEQVWSRSGEWMAYTVDVMASDAYTILLQTGGAPIYIQPTGNCMNPPQGGRGSVVYHLELDGFRVTSDLASDPQVASPRIWMEAGRHQFQQSDNLKSWSPVPRRGLQFKGVGSVEDGRIYAGEPEVWIRMIPSNSARYC